MSRSKKIYILLGVLVLVSLAAFGVSRYHERKEEIKNSDEVILEVSGEDVTSLSWEYEGESLAFHKGENWLYDEDEAFPVDEEKIAGLLSQFEQFGVSFIIENVEDYGQYGLDKPICKINLGTGDKTYEIQLGDYSAMDSKRYVSIGDGNVYLVNHDPFEDFEATIRDMIKQDEIPELSDAKSIRFEGAVNYSATYEEESSNTYHAEDVYFTEQDGTVLPLDTANVRNYLQAVRDLDLTDYVSYNASEEEIASYGLDDPELTLTVEYPVKGSDGEGEDAGENNETFILHVSRAPADKEAALEEENDGEKAPAYVRVGESRIIYQIPADGYDALMDASYNTLRHQEILPADFNDVTQFDITLEGADYVITSQSEDEETLWYYQEEEVSTADIKSALMLLKADRFTDEQPSQKEEIGVTVHLDNVNFPEVKIGLYRYDGSHCLAVVDGEPVALVERSAVVDLVEAVNGIVLD